MLPFAISAPFTMYVNPRPHFPRCPFMDPSADNAVVLPARRRYYIMKNFFDTDDPRLLFIISTTVGALNVFPFIMFIFTDFFTKPRTERENKAVDEHMVQVHKKMEECLLRRQ